MGAAIEGGIDLALDRFDAAVRSLTTVPSRRALLGRAGGVISALFFAMRGAEAEARKRKRKKKKKQCRGCPVCTSCVRTRCEPVPDHTACGGSCQECLGGGCVSKPPDTPCNGTGRCLADVCNSEPDCVMWNVSGCQVLGAQICCSSVCSSDDPNDPTAVCEKGAARRPCRLNTDCIS